MNVSIPCICPPKGDDVRHPDGDTVTLREKLPFQAVSTIRWSVEIERQTDPGLSLAEQFGTISELYLLYGIEAWTVVDDKGKPVAATKAEIRLRLLTTITPAQIVGDVADDLYQEVMLPLLRGRPTFSRPTPTTDSTSPTTGSSEKPPKPSKRSSISAIPTAGTETTSSSLDGVSNSSQSSVSAA